MGIKTEHITSTIILALLINTFLIFAFIATAKYSPQSLARKFLCEIETIVENYYGKPEL
jgi:F0F1-type ATP synthase membrane subunit a